jgi:predicted HTH transcriptional regulator
MKYLSEKPTITVETYANIANISRKVASRTLIVLVLANVIKVQPHEVQDFFVAV